MKALVTDIEKKHIIVLTDQGDFLKLKNNHSYDIGDEIEISNMRNTKSIYTRAAYMAASFIIMVLLGSGMLIYSTPYSYISIDINPSMELVFNRFERLIEFKPLNEDARVIQKELGKLKNQTIETALAQIINTSKDKGYIKKNSSNAIMIVVSNNNKNYSKEMLNRLQNMSSTELAKVNDDFKVVVKELPVEEHKETIQNEQSPGKSMLLNEITKGSNSITSQQADELSIYESINIIEKAPEKEELQRSKNEAVNDKADEKAPKVEDIEDKSKPSKEIQNKSEEKPIDQGNENNHQKQPIMQEQNESKENKNSLPKSDLKKEDSENKSNINQQKDDNDTEETNKKNNELDKIHENDDKDVTNEKEEQSPRETEKAEENQVREEKEEKENNSNQKNK